MWLWSIYIYTYMYKLYMYLMPTAILLPQKRRLQEWWNLQAVRLDSPVLMLLSFPSLQPGEGWALHLHVGS